MNNWKEDYLNVISSSFVSVLEQIKGVLVGFNVNIDEIIEITPDVLSDLLLNSNVKIALQEKRFSKIIRNKSDFFYFLIQSLKEGKADELLLVSNQVSKWIKSVFTVKDIKVGGQAGIMANLLKKLEVNKVLLSLPIFNQALLKLLDSSISIVSEEKEVLSLEEVKNYYDDEINPITHYIFEFKEGTYKVDNETIECSRSNRFIVSFDLINSVLKIRDSFYYFSLRNIKHYSLAIVAGFHLINPEIHPPKTYNEIIEPAHILLEKWKKINPDLTIHLEIAATNDKCLKKLIFDTILFSVDSIGLNEQELLDLLEVTDLLSYNLIRESMSSVNLFKGLLKIFTKYPHLRIHLHYLGYYLILSSPISNEQIKRRKDSLLLASLFTAVKAQKGEIASKNDILSIDVNVSKKGLNELVSLENYLSLEHKQENDFSRKGFITTSSFSLVGVPSIIVEKPEKLVGLGDTISLISILCECF